MILYTKEPYELIFQDAQADTAGIPQTVTEKINDVLVEGIKQADGIQITRLYSTNPRCYLDPGFSPGSIIKRKQ